RIAVRGKCSRLISSSGRPEAFAVARARSMSAISASVSVTIQEVSRARVSPRQARGVVIGVMQTWLTGRVSFSRCVTREDKVSSFRLLVAGEAGLHHRLVGRRFAVLEVTEPPPAGRRVLPCILDHELDVRGGAGHERLVTTKDLVVLLGRNVPIVQRGDDRAVREWELPGAVGLDRDIVAQNRSKTVKVAFFMGHRDQPPVAVSGGNVGHEDRRGLLSRGVSRCPRREGHDAGQSGHGNQPEHEPFHRDASFRADTYWYRGSRASRRPSPRTLSAMTMPKIIRPG